MLRYLDPFLQSLLGEGGGGGDEGPGGHCSVGPHDLETTWSSTRYNGILKKSFPLSLDFDVIVIADSYLGSPNDYLVELRRFNSSMK
jgi:hypothetical protein